VAGETSIVPINTANTFQCNKQSVNISRERWPLGSCWGGHDAEPKFNSLANNCSPDPAPAFGILVIWLLGKADPPSTEALMR
jgi:hypothetical protein